MKFALKKIGSFFFFFTIFKSSITPLIFIFITYYYFLKKFFLKQTSYIYFLITFVTLFFLLHLFFNIVFLKIQPLLQNFNLCFLVFVINFVPLRTQSSLPNFTWERDYWLDFSLPLWTLLLLHQVASVSSLPLLFSTQLSESLCVPDGGEHLGN